MEMDETLQECAYQMVRLAEIAAEVAQERLDAENMVGVFAGRRGTRVM